ncbi:centromere/microtubule binding protein CBF5 [Purpureocillium lilacinum]|uniref:H/ACA ribonucleoprotein complex subunit CBF5 n=1 Tax=Purpureocillium lilacinum TaxID=33203 RepID=A0A179H7V9_PURLI|nr:centromere/microtubule binding protein CBF5 [Purpureocillium lilacinum]OAQ85519.1 centromere/microtubule binding protein CBF5 [Purpureocillium lilacinum]
MSANPPHRCEKTGHSGTLDPKVTGCLIVCIDRATRLVKSQQGAGKEYVCVIRMHDKVPGGQAAFARALETLTGALFQRPPLISAVKRHSTTTATWASSGSAARPVPTSEPCACTWVCCWVWVPTCRSCAACEAVPWTRRSSWSPCTTCWTRSGPWTTPVTSHTCARSFLRSRRSLRRTSALSSRTAPSTPCATAPSSCSPVSCDMVGSGIEHHEEVVLMTTKGEAIALGIAQMSTVEMSTCDHGVVAKVKRCIMERDLYPRRWGLGPVAAEKKKLKADGKLDKFGRPNDATPAKWTAGYQDYSMTDASAAAAAAATTPQKVVEETKMEIVQAETPATEDGDKKKRKKHEGETPDEKAERKRRKAEKKAAKAAKKAGKGEAADDDDSD